MKKPEPVTMTVVCSVCGLGWNHHGEKPTIEKCVELMKAELAKRPKWTPNEIYGPAATYTNPTVSQ